MSEQYLGFFNEEQRMIIDQGTDLGISGEQAADYIDGKYNWEQMYELQMGFVDGLTIPQVKSYANASMPAEEMRKRRKGLVRAGGLEENKDVLMENPNVRNIIEILKQNGMDAEKEAYMSMLLNVDLMSTHLQNQEKTIHGLENKIQDMENEKLRARAKEVLEATKRDLNLLKNKLVEIKNNIVENAIFLGKTFQTSGKVAFCMAFEKFSHGLNHFFQNMKENNRMSLDRTEEAIRRLHAARDEVIEAKKHMKNIGRVLRGKNPSYVEENKSVSVALHATIHGFERHSNVLNQFDRLCDRCIEKTAMLEKSFGKRAKENKKDLNSLISSAAERRGGNGQKDQQRKNEHIR